MRRIFLVIGLALVGGLTAPPPAVAAPTVQVRARTDVQIKPIRRRNDGLLVVGGVMVERASGQGVGGLGVTVDVAGITYDAVTAQDGSFAVVAAASDVPVDVDIRFEGDDRFDPAHHLERGMDPSKMAVDLSVEVQTTSTGALVTADARADGVRAELPVTLRFSGDTPEPHVDIEGTTGKPVMVKRADIFGPGPKRVRARYAGDATHGPATAETSFELGTGTQVKMSLDDDDVAFESTIRARGTVLDDDGKPVARAAVVLLAGTRRLGATSTDKDGTWRIHVAADLLGTGRHSLQGAVETTERWRRPSRSEPLFVTIGTRRPAPVGITLAAFAATAVIAIGFVLARRRPWHKAEPPAPPSPAQIEVKGGLEPARASLVSTLRRAHDHGFAGTVRDAVRGRGLAEAELLLTLGGPEGTLGGPEGTFGGPEGTLGGPEGTLGNEVRRTVADDEGRFAFEELAVGEWSARVASPGHVTEHFTVSIPHRGELRGARIDLVPVREKIFTMYRRAALPILPSPDLWGIWSPRQIVDHVRGATPPARLAELTAFVEECYFSARVPDEGVLPTAESKVAAALAERAGSPAV